MSLKKFVISGIQDVLENKLSQFGRSQQPQPGDDTSKNPNSNYQGGYTSSSTLGNGYNSYGQPGGYSQPGYPQQGGVPPFSQAYPQQGGIPPSSQAYPQPGGIPPSSQAYPQQDAHLQHGVYPQQGGYPHAYPPPSMNASHQVPPPIGFSTGVVSGNQPSYPSGYSSQTSLPNQVIGQPPQGHFNSGIINYSTVPSNQGFCGVEMHGTPSLRPFPNFNANQDAEVLRKAMKGLGCNNSKVISVLCARTNLQRQAIAKSFKVLYGKDLIKDLKSELSGDFEDLILALMEPTAVYDAKQLHKAIQGLGTKESLLIEILTSRTNQQIAEICQAYQQLYSRSLESDIIGDTSGYFQRLLVSLCAGGRDESNHVDHLRANQDARKLYNAGERRLGTDESCFNAILASNNYFQLRAVFDEYQKITNHSIEKAIEAEFSGDIRDGLLAVVAVARNRPAYFAKLLYDSMKGFGTRDSDLIRIVVTRCEYDMVDVRNNFQAMYKTTLEDMIKGDCSGSYKDGLIALVKGNTV